jgi:hypothetical protein
VLLGCLALFGYTQQSGLVIERERHPSEIDKLRWYCRNGDCRHVVYEQSFHCTDLGAIAQRPSCFRLCNINVLNLNSSIFWSLPPFLFFISGKQLAPVIQGYYASSELRTCAACGAVDSPPVAAAAAAASAGSDGSK